MRQLAARVQKMEAVSGVIGGWDFSKPCHMIVVEEGQSDVEALAAYIEANPDKSVEADHRSIWWHVVSPKFDASGNLIPQEREPVGLQGGGPTLGDILKQVAAPEG